MFRPFILLLLLLSSICATASELFTPHFIKSDDAVCNIVLDHYRTLFESDAQSTNGKIKSTKIFNPHFENRKTESNHSSLKTSKIVFGNEEKLVVYHRRTHSWRGDIYTGYIIKPDQLDNFEKQLSKENTFKPFYPIGSLQHGTSFSWWENLPFQHNNHWYVITDFGDFHRHNSVRDVHQIYADGSSKKVCSLKIFENFNNNSPPKNLKVFSSYNKVVEKIMLSPGSCGSNNPEVSARWNGQFFTSTSIYRPWAIELTKKLALQKKHFNDWQYGDVWSEREHAVFVNAKHDAVKELKDYYINTFSYSKENAKIMAKEIVDSLPYRYYSLGIYYNDQKDFSFMNEISSATYRNWNNIQQDLKLRYGNYPLTALTLAIDTPKQLKNLPEDIGLEAVSSSYGKDLLMYAAHMNNYDTVKYLVDSGWPLNNTTRLKPGYSCGLRMSRLNRSALTYAAENASPELIAYLVNAGADIDIKDSKGNGLDYYQRLNPRFSTLSDVELEELLTKAAPSNTIKPSFSCKGGLNKVERAICKSEGLSIYDRELANAYKKAIRSTDNKKRLKESQINWIKTRNNNCQQTKGAESMSACIAKATRARTRYLRYMQ